MEGTQSLNHSAVFLSLASLCFAAILPALLFISPPLHHCLVSSINPSSTSLFQPVINPGTVSFHHWRIISACLFFSFSPNTMFCCRRKVFHWAAEHVKCALVPSFSGYFTPGCFLLISPDSQHSTTQQSLIARRGKSYIPPAKGKKSTWVNINIMQPEVLAAQPVYETVKQTVTFSFIKQCKTVKHLFNVFFTWNYLTGFKNVKIMWIWSLQLLLVVTQRDFTLKRPRAVQISHLLQFKHVIKV